MRLAWGRIAALLGALSLVLVVPAWSATPVTSRFSLDGEGWTAIGDPASGAVPEFVASGGNPGGFIRVRDSNTGLVMYWSAPAPFLGNRQAYYGGNLRFDLAQSVLTTQFDDDDVVLQGNGLTLVFDTPANPAATWTPYVVPLTESAGWVLKGSSPLRPPTGEEFNQVLATLTALRIRAEYSSESGNPDVDQLDNVVLQGVADTDGDAVPDAADACPTVPALTLNGCPPTRPVPTRPTVTPAVRRAPILGKAVNVTPIAGAVFVSAPGGTAGAGATVPGLKGRQFVPLREAKQIPVGSLLDTRRGTARLTSASDSRGATQSGDFDAGVFQVLQSARRSAKGLTELRLKGGSLASCKRTGRGKRAKLSARRTIRRLRGNAKGRFRTRGRYSSATVRGTTWTVTDRCDGTLTQVKSGSVTVRDLRRRRTVVVKAGKSYLARAPR